MINIILTFLSTISMALSLVIVGLVHIAIFLTTLFALYWCIPTAWEKAEYLIEDYQQKKANKKYKKMTKAQKKAHRKLNPITTPYDLHADDKKEAIQRKWDKKHKVLAKIRDTYHTFLAIVWYRVPDYPYDIKLWIKTKYQRAKRGWAVSDAWGLDWYLARVIIEGCEWLKKNKHGIPFGCMPNVQAISTKDDSKDFKKAKKKWDAILDAIIKTFKTSQHIQNSHWYYQNSRTYSLKEANKCRAINKKLRYRSYGLWEKADLHVMTKAECKEYEKGWELFRDNFYGLWD